MNSKLTCEQYDHIKQAAHFQWANILQNFAELTNDQVSVKQGKGDGAPCPICGGNNRYSFKDEERGGWGCRKCGGGDGFDLLQRMNNWDFPTAAVEVGRYLGIVDCYASADFEALRQQRDITRQERSQKENEKLKLATKKEATLWSEAGNITDHPWVAYKQLSSSALAICRQIGSKLLIPVSTQDGVRVTHQQITEVSPGKYQKKFHYGISTKGCFVEFGAKDSEHVLVGESFADADAAFQLAGNNTVTICAFSSSQILAATEYARNWYPESRIVICADNDKAGREAVTKTAARISNISVSYPPSGKDWSEYMLSGGKESPLMNYEALDTPTGKNAELVDSNIVEFPQQQPQAATLKGKELSDSELTELTAMNGVYCHTVIGGRHVIAKSKYCPITGETTTFEPLDQFKNYFHHVPQIAGSNAGSSWINWMGKHHKLGGVTFQPNTADCPADVFNLWRGFKVPPVKGDCSLYLTHLEKVICGGESEAYKYLIGWLAHMIQMPDEKPSVAVFMRSVMGAGKDTMVRALSEILGIHATTQNGDEQITGRFQGALQEKLFVFINEARITDSRAIDRLKSLISEREVSLELKGKDPVRIPNYARFVFASNHDHVIQADPKERRYLMLEPRPLHEVGSPEHYEYFTALHKWIDNGGARYLLEYLQSVDLSEFNPHSAPSTALLTEQKQHSMKNSHQFILEWVGGIHLKEWPARILAGDLTAMYREWLEANMDKKVTVNKAGRELGAAMKELGITPITSNGKRYPLPKLDSMKDMFACLYKTTVEDMF